MRVRGGSGAGAAGGNLPCSPTPTPSKLGAGRRHKTQLEDGAWVGGRRGARPRDTQPETPSPLSWDASGSSLRGAPGTPNFQPHRPWDPLHPGPPK